MDDLAQEATVDFVRYRQLANAESQHLTLMTSIATCDCTSRPLSLPFASGATILHTQRQPLSRIVSEILLVASAKS